MLKNIEVEVCDINHDTNDNKLYTNRNRNILSNSIIVVKQRRQKSWKHKWVEARGWS